MISLTTRRASYGDTPQVRGAWQTVIRPRSLVKGVVKTTLDQFIPPTLNSYLSNTRVDSYPEFS